jgi:hypothetical protein
MADFITMKAKFPDEVLDYSVDWSLRLAAGESIVAHTAVVVRGSVSVTNEGLPEPTQQVFWLTGGAADEDTLVKCEITTDSVPPRIHEIVVRVRVATPS